MYSAFDRWAYLSHMLTVISMFSPCTQWVFGPLSPVTGEWQAAAAGLGGQGMKCKADFEVDPCGDQHWPDAVQSHLTGFEGFGWFD